MTTIELLEKLGFRELFVTVLLLFSTILVVLLIKKKRIRKLPIKRLGKVILASVLWSSLVLLALNIYGRFIAPANFYSVDLSQESLYHLLVSAGIVSPILEEFIFRFVLFGYLEILFREFFKIKGNALTNSVICVSAIAFMILHQDPIQMMYALPSGLILGELYVKDKNLLEPIVFHMGFNLINIALFLIS